MSSTAMLAENDVVSGPVRDMVFYPAMIEALIARRKTATRRIIAFDPKRHAPANWDGRFRTNQPSAPDRHVTLRGLGVVRHLAVPVWTDDRIIVKERFEVVTPWLPTTKVARIRYAVTWRAPIAYVTTEIDLPVLRSKGWKSARFMPRAASRMTLVVTKIGVERLDDITEDEALAEGVYRDQEEGGWTAGISYGQKLKGATPRMAYAVLWDVLHAKTKGHAWRDNPYVLATRFRVEA